MKNAWSALLLLAEVALASPVVGAAQVGPCEDPATPSGQYRVRVRLFGLVAFVPDLPSDEPLSTGATQGITALFPRAFDRAFIDDLNIPTEREFQPREAPHAEHHVFLKVALRNVIAGSTDAQEIRIPLPDPVRGHSQRIEITGATASGSVNYCGFGAVQPILVGRTSPEPVHASLAALIGDGATARMAFGDGWSLRPADKAVDQGKLAYMECPGYPCDTTADYDGAREFAIEVDALSPATSASVSIRVLDRDGLGSERPVLSLPLVRGGNDPEIAVKIVHVPYSELFGGDPHVYEMEHFKLFYVAADEIKPRYYFPHITSRANIMPRADPYCTPLTQFLGRKH